MGQKILVVEDNELNLKLFCDLLRAHGFQAEPVRDGREAVARARSFAPDLVVMDIQMPHVSGLELIEQMKADSGLSPVPIMAVTAYAAKGDEERIREAGAEGYVSKPISLMRFIEAVRALLAAPRPEPRAAEPEQPESEPEEPEPKPEEPEPEPDPEPEPEPEPEPVRLTRRFELPPEAVFRAWTEPEIAARWLFRTPDGQSVRVDIDAVPGGRYEIVERRGGEDILHTGTYEAVEPPTRLVFTLAVPHYSPDEARVEVRIEEEGEGCLLTLSQTVPAGSAAPREAIERGWATLLERLESH